MLQFRNLLFVTTPDGSAEALSRAAALAKKSDAILTVVEVLDELPRDLRMLVPPMGPQTVEELAAAEALERLEQVVEPFRRRGVEIDTDVLLGDPCQELVREAARRNHDLLLVAAAGRPGLRDRIFGSTALQLMRKCPCPVWVVRDSEQPRCGRIVAAVNPENGDENKRRLSRNILEVAAALARFEQSQVDILHVWDLPLEKTFRRRAGLSRQEIGSMIQTVFASAKRSLQELVGQADLQGIQYRLHLTRGKPAPAIAEFARRTGVDLLVMGVMQRTGAAALLAANCAEEVLKELDCSILTIRQEVSRTPAKQQAA
jgi:universal stress protein E